MLFPRVNRGTDPLLQICQEITNQVVNEMAEATVQSTIKTEVHNHMTLIRSADWLEGLIIETIEPMIYSVVSNVLLRILFISCSIIPLWCLSLLTFTPC